MLVPVVNYLGKPEKCDCLFPYLLLFLALIGKLWCLCTIANFRQILMAVTTDLGKALADNIGKALVTKIITDSTLLESAFMHALSSAT